MRLTVEQEQSFYERYKASDCDSVHRFYKKCSVYKARAEKNIREEMAEYNKRFDADDNTTYNAYGYRILGGNGYHFTAAYRLDIEGERVAWRSWLIVFTVHNRYAIRIY